MFPSGFGSVQGANRLGIRERENVFFQEDEDDGDEEKAAEDVEEDEEEGEEDEVGSAARILLLQLKARSCVQDGLIRI